VKDHYLYGLDITPLTEFQTIVQTYYGRALLHSPNPVRDSVEIMREAISDELFGPRGGRVYDPSQDGLLNTYIPKASSATRDHVWRHMCFICESIMLPILDDVYRTNSPLLQLQARTINQPALVDHFLPNITWADRERRLFSLTDNIGWSVRHRAYIDDGLHSITQRICLQIANHVEKNGLQEFGAIFDTSNYYVIFS
jgi:hypothetical protein